MKKIIGITGSIGSGKSYAVNIFKQICKEKNIKAIFIDVDDVRRDILDKEKINRVELNKRIYTSKEEMEKYKNFINPKIKKYLENQINTNDELIFIEWALLIEDNFFDIVDKIIMIDCKQNVQISRLENGDLGKENIIKRINLQLTNLEKIEKIRTLNKEFCIVDTSANPEIKVYREIFEKEVLKYE